MYERFTQAHPSKNFLKYSLLKRTKIDSKAQIKTTSYLTTCYHSVI